MDLQPWLKYRNDLTRMLYEQPYDLVLFLERATAYKRLGYHDLAAGDAYLALLLTDEVANDVDEYHEQAKGQLREHLEHFQQSGWKNDLGRCPCLKEAPESGELVVSQPSWSNALSFLTGPAEEAERLEKLLHIKRLQCYGLLVSSLLECGCLRSAITFCDRGLSMDGTCYSLQNFRTRILMTGQALLGPSESSPDGDFAPEIKDLPDQGYGRREVYPWNEHEPDRFSPRTINTLNESLARVAPRCEVRVTVLPLLSSSPGSNGKNPVNHQLGLFAKDDIPPGEVFLREKSVLTATNRLHEPFCDACGRVLPEDATSSNPEVQVVSCDECEDTLFCSSSCLDLARETYHSATCGRDRLDSIAKDVPAEEASQALYLLLLGRALAMASAQGIHPLDLPELKYIWGDFSPAPSDSSTSSASSSPEKTAEKRLPFSFQMNIASPLHILEALDLDIYASLGHLSDPWIFQTIYAKLRGTASAKMSSSSSSPLDTGITLPLPISSPQNDKHPTNQHGHGSADGKEDNPLGLGDKYEKSSILSESNGNQKTIRIQPRLQRGTTGPDTAAVHPLWCLANHSCAPNVTWEWEDGEMRLWIPARPLFDQFITRSGDSRPQNIKGDANKGEDGQAQQDMPDNERPNGGGSKMIKKGEEILSHYCDVTLPYTERQEWMMGCLGGACMCDRCLREEEADRIKQKTG